MQLKEYFEKFEINYKLWAKRHGIQTASIKDWLCGKRIPQKQTRIFIHQCTLGHVTEADWMEVLYGNAYEGEIGTIPANALGNTIECTQESEENSNLLVNV